MFLELYYHIMPIYMLDTFLSCLNCDSCIGGTDITGGRTLHKSYKW